jgi:RNA polymerase sigma-70 factor (ECF subfamily)
MHDDRPRTLTDAAARRSLVRAAARLLGPAEAEDAVQDACVRALEADAAQLAGLGAAQAWLHTVVRHLAIDRLRRRQWMQQWLAGEVDGIGGEAQRAAFPSAESDAALGQESARALRLLAARLPPADGAAVLLYEVFEASHAELAQAGGKTEAASRQQLRRALLRLRQVEPKAGEFSAAPRPAPDEREEAVLRVYLQSLQLRDPQALWAMLRQPPVHAMAGASAAAGRTAPARPATTCGGVVQLGGQLGLVLTLDGVRLCVLPLGVRAVCDQGLEPVAA